MRIKETDLKSAEPGRRRRSASDLLSLFGAGILETAALVTFLSLIESYRIPEFWYWGTVMGPGTFFPVMRFLRKRFRQRGFLYYCAGWFPVHMIVMYLAAWRLPVLIALFPVALELFVGFTIAYWLFGRQR